MKTPVLKALAAGIALGATPMVGMAQERMDNDDPIYRDTPDYEYERRDRERDRRDRNDTLDSGVYFGANYSMFEFDNDDIGEELNPDAIVLRAGIEMYDWLGLEARGGVGLSDDSTSVAGIGRASAEIDWLYGAYARVGVPVMDVAMPYVIGGWTRIEGEAELSTGGVGTSTSGNVDDVSWGAGVDLNVSETVALNLEYMRYIDDSSDEVSALGLGLRTAF